VARLRLRAWVQNVPQREIAVQASVDQAEAEPLCQRALLERRAVPRSIVALVLLGLVAASAAAVGLGHHAAGGAEALGARTGPRSHRTGRKAAWWGRRGRRGQAGRW